MLPIYTTPKDVESVVAYLKNKATGATIAEARAVIVPNLLDDRKLAAYEAWGFVARDGDRLRLSDIGRRFSRGSEEQKKEIYANIVRNIPAYRVAVDWMFHQGLSTVTTVDLASHWHQHISKELGTEREDSIRSEVTAFFQIAEAAGLGTYFVGRKQQPSRFEVVKDALGQLIGEIGIEGAEIVESETLPESAPSPAVATASEEEAPKPATGLVRPVAPAAPEHLRVFISHSKNTEIVDQLRTMLELANLDNEVAEEEETTAIPVPDKVLTAMRRCGAAVICVTADEERRRDDGSYGINENVLIEIGAAFVLYEKRVVLVWDRRMRVPSNLQGLYRCEFEGNELSWSAGMKLMKAVNQFKRTGSA